MRTIEIPRVGHRLEALQLNEAVIYTISMADHLNGDTLREHTYTVLDSTGEDVTATNGGDSSLSGDICTFGLIAHAAGIYTIQLWMTCNEYLPDNTTLRTFVIELQVAVK